MPARPSGTATGIPTTCSARRRAPRPMPRATSRPTITRSRRSAGRLASRDIAEAPGISVKLSALHPRYEMAQRDRVLRELSPRLLDLACHARQAGIGFTIDAEEADRLDLSLDLVEGLALAPDLAGWDGLGLAVQAYQKRALPVIDWLADLAGRGGRRLMVRLVKGAYWDSEIKRAQERGLDGYPVYTRKVATDVSYLACASRLLAARRRSLSAIRDPQRAYRRGGSRNGRQSPGLGVPAPARHGRGALRADRRARTSRPAVPDLCAGRQP